ncbi:MAG: hypothetical protein FWE45_01190 [Firmicutes bacterium]|nr:hypothetical protein [Bacillota bacterium]
MSERFEKVLRAYMEMPIDRLERAIKGCEEILERTDLTEYDRNLVKEDYEAAKKALEQKKY